MALEGKITALQNDDGTEVYLPMTKVKAVSDDNGTALNVLLDNKLDKKSSAVDSEKLGGKLPSDLAVNADILWGNASPSSEFGEQAVNLTYPVSDYKFILILFRAYGAQWISTLVPSDIVEQVQTSYSGIYIVERLLNLNGSKVIFANGSAFLTYAKRSKDNKTLIPMRIYGIK